MVSKEFGMRHGKESVSVKKFFPQNYPQNFNFQDLQVGLCIEYPEGNSNFWSNITYSILSFSRVECANPSLEFIQRYIPHPDRYSLTDILVRIKNKTLVGNESIVFRYKKQDAASKLILFSVESVVGIDGKVEHWIGSILDITELAKTEDKCKIFANNTLNFLGNFPLLMAFVSPQGVISFWNKALEDFTGYKASEVMESRELLKILIPNPADRRKLRQLNEPEKQSSIRDEIVIVTKKGVQKIIEWEMYRFSTGKDTWKSVLIGRDVTEAKQASKENEIKTFQLEALSSIAVDLLVMPQDENCFHHLGLVLEKYIPNSLYVVSSIDSELEFMTVEGVYGFESDEWQQALDIIGWNPVGRRFPYNGVDLPESDAQELMQIEKSLYEFSEGEISSAASRNLERFFSIDKLYSASIHSDKKLYGSIFLFSRSEDISDYLILIQEILTLYSMALERRMAEEELLKAKTKAEEIVKLKSVFMANFGHEIRTPMNAILGFTQLLSLPNLTKEKKKQYIDIIGSKGRMLVKLINDMVDVSKAESGELTVVKSVFSVNQLMLNLKDFYGIERVFQQREAIEIRLILPENSDDNLIFSDEGRLEQVFTNLIDNALKFTERGSVEFGFTMDNGKVEFFVKDTGIGIDSRLHKAIFDRYKQVGEKIERTREGKGLGLAICKGIIELLGGEIWVESEPGQGAIFKFTVPIVLADDDQFAEDESKVEEQNPVNWKNKVILVVEDEEINYLFITELLEPTGANIIWARDGEQAVELVQSIKNIDAILMDIRMPKKNGYAATLEIRQINPNIPIIAQTAYAFSEDRAKAIAAGCNDYITKPINSQELLSILDRYLG